MYWTWSFIINLLCYTLWCVLPDRLGIVLHIDSHNDTNTCIVYTYTDTCSDISEKYVMCTKYSEDVHHDLRKYMFTALVWNYQQLLPAPFSYNYPSRSFFCMSKLNLLIRFIIELQYNLKLYL